jgi:hypothetical protein
MEPEGRTNHNLLPFTSLDPLLLHDQEELLELKDLFLDAK